MHHSRLGPAALLLTALVLALVSVSRESLTYDEPVHYRYGAQLLRGDAARFDDSKMPVSALTALPGRIADALPAGAWRNRLAAEEAGRFVAILVLLGLHALVYRVALRLYGPDGALLSLALCVFDPNLLAHGRLVTNDVPLSFAVLLACFAFRQAVVHGGTGRLLLAALAFGVAQVAKYTSVYLVPVFLLVLVVRLRARPSAADLRRFAQGVLAFVAVTLVVVNAAFLFDRTFTPLASYPWRSAGFASLTSLLGPLARLPFPLPYPYVEGLDWVLFKERDGVGFIWLLGELRDGKGFPFYFAWAWLLKVPLATQALLAAALAAYVTGPRRARFRDDEVFFLVPAGFFIVYFFTMSQAQWGVRFLLPIFPLLYVFAGSLLVDAERVVRRVAIASAAATAISVLSWHPHYLSYFNEIVRDRDQAWRYLADSNLDWGQNQWYLDRWLEKHPDARVEPRSRKAGLIVVGVNKLVGVFNPPRYRWLRENFEPVDVIAYSWLVYDVPPERLRALPLDGMPPEPGR